MKDEEELEREIKQKQNDLLTREKRNLHTLTMRKYYEPTSSPCEEKRDRRFWDLNGDGYFRVKDVRRMLDDMLLPKSDVPSRWVKQIPIKNANHTIRVWGVDIPCRKYTVATNTEDGDASGGAAANGYLPMRDSDVYRDNRYSQLQRQREMEQVPTVKNHSLMVVGMSPFSLYVVGPKSGLRC
nr:RNA-directed DNA polymerase, eukaryota [Tanacetum cinerariifolium]